MKEEILDLLFSEITEVTKIKDVGYHEIKDGKLNPVYKTSTQTLDIEKWKRTHMSNPVQIDKTPILVDILNTKEPAVISDVKNDSRSHDAFFLFGIDSISIMPVIENEAVKGIVSIASIGKSHKFHQDEITKCKKLVNKYFLNQ